MLFCTAGRFSSLLVGRLGVVKGVEAARGGVWSVETDKSIGNWKQKDRSNLWFSTKVGAAVRERRKGLRRKMSISEGAEVVTESGYVASDGGVGEGVNNGVGGIGLLQGGAGDSASVVVDQGFTRPEMFKEALAGTVNFYERHVFLCYKEPESWPARVEAADFDRLPRFLVAALRARKHDMPKKTRLTICEGRDGTESSSGDVLIFPEMIRYRGLTHFDVDSFVEDVLVKGKDWVGSSKAEHLEGSYVFVCAHGTRDARCGVCGPVLIQKFQQEISSRGLDGQIFVRPCSHIGGHKYAGNVIVFTSTPSGQVSGHWYGYVVPEDIPALLDQHIGKGEIIDRLWRGQMGLAEEEQKLVHQDRLRCQQEGTNGCACSESQVRGVDGDGQSVTTCCQTLKSDLAESAEVAENGYPGETNEEAIEEPESPRAEVIAGPKADNTMKEISPVKTWSSNFFRQPKWIQTWEREDTQAALAVIGVAALVTVAFHAYKRSASS